MVAQDTQVAQRQRVGLCRYGRGSPKEDTGERGRRAESRTGVLLDDGAIMAARANWKGVLKIGEVSCPIALYTAASTAERITFHVLNRETGHGAHREFVDANVWNGGSMARLDFAAPTTSMMRRP